MYIKGKDTFFSRVVKLFKRDTILTNLEKCIKEIKVNEQGDVYIEFTNNLVIVNNNMVSYSKGVCLRDSGIRISDNPDIATMDILGTNKLENINTLLEKDRLEISRQFMEKSMKAKEELEYYDKVFTSAAKTIEDLNRKDNTCTH